MVRTPGMKILIFIFTISTIAVSASTIHYDLHLTDTVVEFTGKRTKGIAINGQIPGPVLRFTEGDTAEIVVHNHMHMESSVHWHGVFLPNQFDGVPFLTQLPIAPHSTYTYRFLVKQNGTFWYHSHTELQEQIGMYGVLIFDKVKRDSLPEIPVMLSDWTDHDPMKVNRWLHNATDWFAIKKGSTQSYAEAISGHRLKIKLENEWKRV